MYEDICAQLGKCLNPLHDHGERIGAPGLSSLVDTTDPAFEAIARVLADMNAAGVKLTLASVDVAIRLGRLYQSKREQPAVPQQTAYGLRHEVVYYMRFGHLIKIGTTGLLGNRARELKPDEVLAAEPGSYDLESERHRQFGRFLAEGEYFFPAPALMAHIRKVRVRYRRTLLEPVVTQRYDDHACDPIPSLF